jgi:hypothetical protein
MKRKESSRGVRQGSHKKRKKRGDVVIRLRKLHELTGFQQLAYITRQIGIEDNEIANIIEMDLAIVKTALDQGSVPDSVHKAKAEQVAERLYLLYRLLARLLRLSENSEDGVRHLLSETTEFRENIEQPPWYQRNLNLREYLEKDKDKAVRSSLSWLITH